MNEVASVQDMVATIREARKLLRRDPVMRLASFKDALVSFFGGDFDLGKLHLRDVVKYGIGYDALAMEMGVSIQSISRMLSQNGNPTSRHLFLMLQAVRKYEGFEVQMQIYLDQANNN